MRRSLALASVSVLAVGFLAACSSSDDSSGDGEMVGGMTECTDEIINQAAEEYVNETSGGANAWYPESVQCADGWAVASGINGEADAPEDGPMGAPTNIIFEAEGQFWVPKDAADVCGTYEDGSYPSDAEIPEALYDACLSG